MTLRRLALLLLAVSFALAGSARAETIRVRTATQLGLTFLTFMVMEHEHMVEKEAQARGLPDVETVWSRLADGGAINDALLSGSIDFAPNGVPAFLTLWDKTRGNFNVMGIGAYNAITLSLLVRDPKVHSIADLTDKDRIAIPGVQASSQAVLLEMAAEKAFGPGNARKLDPLTVSRGHPDAVAAFLSGSPEITAHFSSPPFVERELQAPNVHTILTSRDVYGEAGTIGILFTTSKYCATNPKLCDAYFAAMGDAIALINADRHRAAEIYLDVSKVKDTVENIEKILREPDMIYDEAPHGTMTVAVFLQKLGTIKHVPASWQELFFPDARKLAGS